MQVDEEEEQEHEEEEAEYEEEPVRKPVKRRRKTTKKDAARNKRKTKNLQDIDEEEVEEDAEEEHEQEEDDEQVAGEEDDAEEEAAEEEEKEGDDYSRIQTRVSPNCLYKATKQMSPEQMDVVRRIGFGRILEMEFNKIPLGLGYFCVENFNHETAEIEIPTGKIEITRESIKMMFDLPMGDVPIETSIRPKKGESTSKLWRKQYNKRNVTPPQILDRIVKEKRSGWTFILDFLVLCASTIIEGNQLGSANYKFLKCVKDEDQIKNLDWCGYMLTCLKEGVKSWKDETTGDKFIASLTCLVLHYVQSTNCGTVYVPTHRHTVAEWTTNKLFERENAEIALGGFGFVEMISEEEERNFQTRSEELIENAFTKEELEHNLKLRYKYLVGYNEEMDAALLMYPESKVFKEISDKMRIIFENRERVSTTITPIYDSRKEDYRDISSTANMGDHSRKYNSSSAVPFSFSNQGDPTHIIANVLNNLSREQPENNDEENEPQSSEKTESQRNSANNEEQNEEEDDEGKSAERNKRARHVALVYRSPYKQREVEINERLQLLEKKIARYLACFLEDPG